LLDQKVDPDNITWIVSREAWLIDRQNTQPTEQFFTSTVGNLANQFEAIAESTSIDDMFEKLEARGVFVRIDQSVKPQMFHGATISQLELIELRKIKNIVRLGRVQHLGASEIKLDHGSIPTSPDMIHVDCSASAITNLSSKPVFEEGRITPQTVRAYQPVFSASVIAYVEANYDNDKQKNNLCQVVPLPNHDTDWISMTATQMVNQITWSQDKQLRRWVRSNRLDGFANMIAGIDKSDDKKMQILQRMKNAGFPAMMKLKQYISELESAS